MKDQPEDLLELRCRQCAWSELCGVSEMINHLQRLGMMRRPKEVDPATVRELFLGSADRMACPDCGQAPLVPGPPEEEQAHWPGSRRCEGCGEVISSERVAAMPDIRICVACQGRDEAGSPTVEQEYCPRCGSAMILRQSSGAGLTRYRMVCSASPACRG